MKDMVAGFLFNRYHRAVVLIKKARPEWQEGRLNGVGGKMEPGETPLEAMDREWSEETGGPPVSWKAFATLGDGKDWRVTFFVAVESSELVMRLFLDPPPTDEPLRLIKVSDMDNVDVLPNLRWLIPMGISVAEGEDRCGLFEIREAA